MSETEKTAPDRLPWPQVFKRVWPWALVLCIPLLLWSLS